MYMKKAEDYIVQNEGYRRYMYYDTEGIPTIGIGFNLEQGFSQEECVLILRHRLDKLVDQLRDRVFQMSQINAVRRIVLLDMSYNLGVDGLLKFKKMLAALNVGNFELAADEMLDSRYALQVKGRARRNAQMMRTGEWFE